MIIYGIKNCSTMKKAFDILNEKGVNYEFHDYKKEGISKEKIAEWMNKSDLSKLINNKGTTYRNLSPLQQKSLSDPQKALKIMIENPSIIKRPILEAPKKFIIGLDTEEYNKL